ncbi:DNA polymerase III subunit gamma/tau [Ferrimonas balearica]|uniref:DNA polymerase III subunit gamma/tau n=1 Tax=Ferrimonas balearica TaxID=44012 RepID=UPI001C99A325|nr:DNA polymerase III subunit gamma/tau [Ferrimonas balearica]MBY5990860.1 DNA polymerase III subunit gamma/tau [Ferrimonas balearica]
MSYQVLARKWRPASFDQVVGQEHVLKALTHALEQNRLHHAYLFTGTRGVGKTSIARLLAKGLNCETGITATPCGQCSHCQEISEGRFVDLLEIDAASRTKVDDTREILDNVQYQPVRGRFKVYLIDEVHMLSRHSFNALLKTLEEPPPHVKFLLATTDPQKLPVTVLSRCLQFNLKSVTPARISAHLAKVLAADGIACEPAALDLLAQAADGSVRDGMSLTDQAIAHGGGALKLGAVQAMLGTLDTGYALRLLKALAQGQAEALMAVLDEIDAFAPDHDDLLKQMAALLHQAALCQFNLRAADLGEQGAEVQTLAQALDREQVQLWYQMLTQGRQDLALAPDPRSGFEMVLLRALAFAPVEAAPPMAARQPQLNHPVSPGAVAPVAQPVEAKPETKPEPKPKPEPKAEPAPSVAPSEAAAAAAAQQPEKVEPKAEAVQPQQETAPQSAPAQAPVVPDEAAELAQEQSAILSAAEAGQGRVADPIPMPQEELAMLAEQEMILAQAEAERGAPMESPLPNEPRPAPVAEAAPSAASGAGIQGLLEQALSNQRNIQARLKAAEPNDPKPEAVTVAPKPVTATPKTKTEAPSPAATPVNDELDRPPWDTDEPVTSAAAAPSEPAPKTPEAPQAKTGQAPAPAAEAAPQQQAQPKAEPAPAASVPATPSETAEEQAPGGRPVAANEADALWYQTISQLGIGARPRQLAINSLLEREGEAVTLHLRSEQRHLNSEAVIGPLKEAMERVWQQGITLKIVDATLKGRETPLEIRRRLHQERLAQAKADLLQDPVVQWLQSEFDARLIEESVSYQNPG